MKQLLVILALAFNFFAYSQDDKTVTLTVSAQGETIKEAKQNALRDAIEQAFGTFISSNTEILNDSLVKDEIVSVSNGNIQEYEVLSEVKLPSDFYSTTLKATVSVTNLTSFVESKGVSVEFKGGLFAFNINQQTLNEQNEIKAIEDVCKVIDDISKTSFDYSIEVADPISLDGNNEKWRIPMYISVYRNNNFENIPNVLYNTLKGLSLSKEEAENYLKLGKDIYPVCIAVDEDQYDYFVLRKKESIKNLVEMLYRFRYALTSFEIVNGIDTMKINDDNLIIQHIYDLNFRNFLKMDEDKERYQSPRPMSVFWNIYGERNQLGIIKKDLGYTRGSDGIPMNRLININDLSERIGKDPQTLDDIYDFPYGDYLMKFDNRFNHMEERLFRFYTNLPKKKNTFISKLRRKKGMLEIEDSRDSRRTSDYAGLVISFIATNSSNESVGFNIDDIRRLEELNYISKYEVFRLEK